METQHTHVHPHVHPEHCPVRDKIKCVLVLLLAALAFAWLGMPKFETVAASTDSGAIVVRYNRITGHGDKMENCKLSRKDEDEFFVLDKRDNMTDAEWARFKDLDNRRKSPCWIKVESDSGKDIPPAKD